MAEEEKEEERHSDDDDDDDEIDPPFQAPRPLVEARSAVDDERDPESSSWSWRRRQAAEEGLAPERRERRSIAFFRLFLLLASKKRL